MGKSLREVVDAATVLLADAGVGSPRVDAVALAAHAAGTGRDRLLLDDGPGAASDDFVDRFGRLVAARSRRVPLQHLTGTAPFGPVEVSVGPGVFIPRPETEALLEWAVGQPLPERPVVVDLCTGSGALALALARRWPRARVLAIDDSAEALAYAHRNVELAGVELVHADVTDAGLLPELDESVDLLVANPPYIPDGVPLEPEVAQHDPEHALFGGPDGMDIIRAIVTLAARWLRPGAGCAVEHDDTTCPQTVAAFDDTAFIEVTARRDLAGRSRFVTARRVARSQSRTGVS